MTHHVSHALPDAGKLILEGKISAQYSCARGCRAQTPLKAAATRVAQTELERLGILPGLAKGGSGVDGKFGTSTAIAVTQFQIAYNQKNGFSEGQQGYLKVDGTVGRNTLAAMKATTDQITPEEFGAARGTASQIVRGWLSNGFTTAQGAVLPARPVTQPVVQQDATPPVTQPVVQQDATPPVTQPVVQQDATPPVTQPVAQQDATPPVTQPVVQQDATPPVTQPVAQQDATPPVTQPVVQQDATPPVTQTAQQGAAPKSDLSPAGSWSVGVYNSVGSWLQSWLPRR